MGVINKFVGHNLSENAETTAHVHSLRPLIQDGVFVSELIGNMRKLGLPVRAKRLLNDTWVTEYNHLYSSDAWVQSTGTTCHIAFYLANFISD